MPQADAGWFAPGSSRPTAVSFHAASGRAYAETRRQWMAGMKAAMDDQSVAQRVLDHIANGTTDIGKEVWREPVANYRSNERLAAEIERVLRRSPTPFCPATALPEAGSYIAREAAGTPIVVVRGAAARVRAF